MRWALVTDGHGPACVQFPLCLPLHQNAQAVRQFAQLVLLPCDDIGQVVNRATEVGDLFFEAGLIGHRPD